VLALPLAGVALAYPFRRGLRRASPADTATAYFLMTTTGVIGDLTEAWGTPHGHWTYNHLPAGQSVPLWVPLAWALAGVLLQRLDRRVLDPGWPVPRRLATAYAFGFVFPLLGESICIANGVWAYHWPLEILGVPLLALLLIAYAQVAFHLMHQGIERRDAAARAGRVDERDGRCADGMERG